MLRRRNRLETTRVSSVIKFWMCIQQFARECWILSRRVRSRRDDKLEAFPHPLHHIAYLRSIEIGIAATPLQCGHQYGPECLLRTRESQPHEDCYYMHVDVMLVGIGIDYATPNTLSKVILRVHHRLLPIYWGSGHKCHVGCVRLRAEPCVDLLDDELPKSFLEQCCVLRYQINQCSRSRKRYSVRILIYTLFDIALGGHHYSSHFFLGRMQPQALHVFDARA